MIREEFKEHLLSDQGKIKTAAIARAYSDLVKAIEALCPPGRHLALAKTNVEQSYYWAIQAAATNADNLRQPEPGPVLGGGRHG